VKRFLLAFITPWPVSFRVRAPDGTVILTAYWPWHAVPSLEEACRLIRIARTRAAG
jgi:hypothetical protein